MKALLFASLLALTSAQILDPDFERKINAAVADVKNLFDPSRTLAAATSTPHYYEDKFYLAEFVSTTGSASAIINLDRLGITLPQLGNLRKSQLDAGSSVIFVFRARPTVTFVKKEAVENGKVIETITTIFGAFSKSTVNIVTRYHWNVTVTATITATNPLDPAVFTVLKSTTSSVMLYRTSDQAPTLPDGDATLSMASVVSLMYRVFSEDTLTTAPGGICRPPASPHAGGQCMDTASVVAQRVLITRNVTVTPTNNPAINGVKSDMADIARFASSIASYINNLAQMTAMTMPPTPTFTPAVLVMDAKPCGTPAADLDGPTLPVVDQNFYGQDCSPSVVLNGTDVATLLTRYDAVVGEFETEALDKVSKYVALVANNAPPQSMGTLGTRTAAGLITGDVVDLFTGSNGLVASAAALTAALNGVRDMLYKQVSDAIGQHVSADDVMMYATGVGSLAFLDASRPSGFSYAIRRSEAATNALTVVPDTTTGAAGGSADANAAAGAAAGTSGGSARHAVVTAAAAGASGVSYPPEGFLSLEWKDSKATWRPLKTVAQDIARAGWKLAISDGVDAVLNTTATAHGFVVPSFGGSSGQIGGVALNINARPFSGLILVAGSVSELSITPEIAVIVRDRDALQLPVVLDPIPSPKDFAKAISSISPRMKAFAQAFRALQLSKSVLAIAAIPLKPQMESILQLPAGALSKHIELTDNLLRLFLDYGISPSLLAYNPVVDGAAASNDTAAGASVAVAAVKRNVANVLAAIDAVNKRALDIKEQETKYANGGVPASGKPETTYWNRGDVSTSVDYAAGGGHVEDSTGSSPGSGTGGQQQGQQQGGPGAYTPQAISAETVTTLAKALDARFLVGDVANALRPTILSIGDAWTRTRALSFLEKPTTAPMAKTTQDSEKKAALQLLDILTEAGGVSVMSASLHFVLGATHNFADSVMSSVVDGNMNVLQDVTRSILMVSEVLTGLAGTQLVDGKHADAPALLGTE